MTTGRIAYANIDTSDGSCDLATFGGVPAENIVHMRLSVDAPAVRPRLLQRKNL